MNRGFTNAIRTIMDEWIPPAIRDSHWFMFPFFWFAYRGKNIQEVMDFKRRVYHYSPDEYARFYHELDTISRHRKTDLNGPCLKFILENIDSEAHNLIDVGCGNGYLLQRIREQHPELKLSGFDIKPKCLSEGVSFFEGNIEHLPFPDKSFDIVTCSHTLEHLLNLPACVAELMRITRRQLFVVTPRQRAYLYTLDEHVNFFPFEEKLASLFTFPRHKVQNLGGDWVYLGETLDRER